MLFSIVSLNNFNRIFWNYITLYYTLESDPFSSSVCEVNIQKCLVPFELKSGEKICLNKCLNNKFIKNNPGTPLNFNNSFDIFRLFVNNCLYEDYKEVTYNLNQIVDINLAKKKGMGGLLPGLLKWIIIGLAAIILVVVVLILFFAFVLIKDSFGSI